MKVASKWKMFAAVMGIVIVSPGAALAQNFPTRPSKFIVPFPAGGPADLFARELSQGMAADLKQPLLVENKGGVGGTLGVDLAAKAPPDGYTPALDSGSALVIQPYARKKMLYDADKDLALITTVVKVPEVARQFASISAVPIPSTPEKYRKFVTAERIKWGGIIKAIGFQPEE